MSGDPQVVRNRGHKVIGHGCVHVRPRQVLALEQFGSLFFRLFATEKWPDLCAQPIRWRHQFTVHQNSHSENSTTLHATFMRFSVSISARLRG